MGSIEAMQEDWDAVRAEATSLTTCMATAQHRAVELDRAKDALVAELLCLRQQAANAEVTTADLHLSLNQALQDKANLASHVHQLTIKAQQIEADHARLVCQLQEAQKQWWLC